MDDSNMSSCFFCLQYFQSESDYDSDEAEPGSNHNQFSLRHVSRFIKLFQEYGAGGRETEITQKELKRKLFKFANDSLVPVCNECTVITRDFSELYEVLEETKLRLDWCVRRMYDVMAKAEDESGLLKVEAGDEDEMDIMGTLRAKTMDQMSSWAPVPRVLLRKTKVQSVVIVHRPRSERLPSPGKVSGPESLELEPELIKLEPLPTTSSCSGSDYENDEGPSNANFTVEQCCYCRAKFSSTCPRKFSSPKRMLHQHILQYHCEHFFKHLKLNSITDSQFQKILAELLFKGCTDENQRCVYCTKKKFNRPSVNRHRHMSFYHMFHCHKSIIEEKLMKIQEDPNLLEILAECNPKARVCPCGVYLPNVANQRVHNRYHCVLKTDGDAVVAIESSDDLDNIQFASSVSETTKETPKPATTIKSNGDVQCTYCNAKFQEQASCSGAWIIRQHTLQYHCEHYFHNQRLTFITLPQFKKILVDLLFTDLIFKGKESCNFCEKKFPNPGGTKNTQAHVNRIKSHLVESHFEELKEKLISIQKDPNLVDVFSHCNPNGVICDCGVYLPDLDSQTKHDQFHCRLSKKQARKHPVENIVHVPPLKLKQKTKKNPAGPGPSNIRSDLALTTKRIPVPDQVQPQPKPTFKDNFIPFPPDKEKVSCKLCNKIVNRKAMRWHWTYICRQGLLHRPPNKDRGHDDLLNIKASMVSCCYCRNAFSGPDRSNLLDKHLVRFHLEHYFSEEGDMAKGQQGLTNDQFQRIIHHILFPEFMPKSGSGSMQSCKLCQKTFSFKSETRNKYLLRKHLVFQHRRKLRQRLLEILDCPILHSWVSLFDSDRYGMSCECGMYLAASSGKWSRNYHDRFHCNLKSVNPSMSEEERFGGDRDEFLVDSDDDFAMRNHISSSSLKAVSEVIRRSSCKKRKIVPVPKKKKRTKTHKIPGGGGFSPLPTSCPYCRFVTRADNTNVGMSSHLLRFHPQYYFPDVTQDQDLLQRVLQDILFPELIPAVVTGSTTTATCNFCGETLESRDSQNHCSFILRRHLLHIHEPEFRDQLQLILQDPNLKERLKMTNPAGVSCPCGMYLANGIKFRNKYHEKYQCILAAKVIKSENQNRSSQEKGEDNLLCPSLPPSNLRIANLQRKMNFPRSCPNCIYAIPKGSPLKTMDSHMACFHLEYFFPNVKHEALGVSLAQFQKVLNDILFPELIPKFDKSLSCSLCDENFVSSTELGNHFKVLKHLMDEHKSQCDERLKAILEDPELQGKLSGVNPYGDWCECGMYLPNGLGHHNKHHERNYCKLKAEEIMERKQELDKLRKLKMDNRDPRRPPYTERKTGIGLPREK